MNPAGPRRIRISNRVVVLGLTEWAPYPAGMLRYGVDPDFTLPLTGREIFLGLRWNEVVGGSTDNASCVGIITKPDGTEMESSELRFSVPYNIAYTFAQLSTRDGGLLSLNSVGTGYSGSGLSALQAFDKIKFDYGDQTGEVHQDHSIFLGYETAAEAQAAYDFYKTEYASLIVEWTSGPLTDEGARN